MKALPVFAALLMIAVAVQAQPAEAVVVAPENVEWTEIVPGISFGAVYGDWSTEAHGKYVRIDPGVETPPHTHTLPYSGVVISGRVTNPYSGEEAPAEMSSGKYWYVPGGEAHTTACVSDEPCLFYTHADGAWDLEVIEQ